jgi:prepilin-type N-terminal cleavage/methylation domain-containing protein
MKTKFAIRRGFTLVELLVVIVIIAALAGLTAPMIIRQARKADAAEAVSNAKQIGLAMFEFQTDYGSYPDTGTITTVTTNNPASVYLADIAAPTTANGYFMQLFAAGITQSEAMFYAKSKLAIKSDGNIDTGEALADGECGFAYILDGTDGQTAAGNPSRIIAAAPMKDATKFDIDPYDKKAVILRIDNSVISVNIDEATGVAKANGANILDKATSKFWGGVTPTVVIPLPAP